MQKKKPPFQVIPNCGVSGPAIGMNLKKWLRNKAGMPVPARFLRPLRAYLCHQWRSPNCRGDSQLEPNSSVLAAEWCGAIGWFLRDVAADTAALFIELSGEI
jgi:hypothetical protein